MKNYNNFKSSILAEAKGVLSLILTLFILAGQAIAQNMEDFSSRAEKECVEGNCKNGTGILKIWPNPNKKEDFVLYKGTFQKKLLTGIGTFCTQTKYDSETTITGNFVDGRIVLGDTLSIAHKDYTGKAVFSEPMRLNSSYPSKTWAKIIYKGASGPTKAVSMTGVINFLLTGFKAEWATTILGNGIRINGSGGIVGGVHFPCGASGFNYTSSFDVVLIDTLPGGIIRKGPYNINTICNRNGIFTHRHPDGSEVKVKYENDVIVGEEVITADSVKERERLAIKASNDYWDKKRQEAYKQTDEYKAKKKALDYMSPDSLKARLARGLAKDKRDVEYYRSLRDGPTIDENACLVCKGEPVQHKKRCPNACINGRVSQKTNSVKIIDGGIGRKGVGFYEGSKSSDCKRCQGTGVWVCNSCNGTGLRN